MTIYKPWEMTSVLLHKETNFNVIINSSFQSQSTLFWELFRWEKICKLVQIGAIVMFNNLFYVNHFSFKFVQLFVCICCQL